MPKNSDLVIFCGGANPKLSSDIAKSLNKSLGDIEVGRFSDGEIRIKIETNVRGKDVFILQPTIYPYSENIMRLLLIIDAVRRASAKRITAVVPYYAYSRQEKKSQGREPIAAKLVANILTTSGVDRIMAMDLHASAIQGFFDIPLDHLTAVKILAEYFIEKNIKDTVVVSPDAGGTARARSFARLLGSNLAIIDKRRPRANEAEIMNIIGDVKQKTAIIIDDIIDTAGTMTKAAKALMNQGAEKVYAACTHGVLSGPAVDRINDSVISELIVADTIPLGNKKISNVKVLSVAPMLSEAIYRVHNDYSISELFQ